MRFKRWLVKHGIHGKATMKAREKLLRKWGWDFNEISEDN